MTDENAPPRARVPVKLAPLPPLAAERESVEPPPPPPPPVMLKVMLQQEEGGGQPYVKPSRRAKGTIRDRGKTTIGDGVGLLDVVEDPVGLPVRVAEREPVCVGEADSTVLTSLRMR